MEDCNGCRQKLFLINIKKQGARSTTITPTHSKSTRVDSITINLSCDTRILKVSGWEQSQPLIFNSVRVDNPQILYSKTTQEAVKSEISGWNVSDYWKEWMIKNVLSSVRDMVKTVPTVYNALDVLVEVVVVHDHTRRESIPPPMVSVADSSLKKKKKICRLARRLSIGHLFSRFLLAIL